MLLLVNGSTKTVNELISSKYLGKYISPNSHSHQKSIDLIVEQRCIWGADNDCYNSFNQIKYEQMLSRLPRINTMKYLTMPDVLGDSEKTLTFFDEWYSKLKNEKLPITLVLQDGCKVKDVPFDKIKSVFVGGTTEYKLSEDVRNIINIAKQKKKWIHMGRVNSNKRIKYAQSIGVDSFDGSSFSMFANTLIPKTLLLLKHLDKINKNSKRITHNI